MIVASIAILKGVADLILAYRYDMQLNGYGEPHNLLLWGVIFTIVGIASLSYSFYVITYESSQWLERRKFNAL